jgi:hypothetical protein
MARIGRDYFSLIAEAHVPANTGGFIDLTPQFKAEAESYVLKDAVLIAPAVGSPSEADITIAGTYSAGDEVRVTLTSNATSRQVWRKSYVYEVQPADTNNDIAAAMNALIAADGLQVETPYTSSVATNVITVVAKTDDKQALQGEVYTDSAAGTITFVLTPAVISEGQPSDLVDRGIDPLDINLAQYDTVRVTYCPQVAQPFIDTPVGKSVEIYLYLTVGNGAGVVTLIQGL